MSSLINFNLISADLMKFYRLRWTRVLLLLFAVLAWINVVSRGTYNDKLAEFLQPTKMSLLMLNFYGNSVVSAFIIIPLAGLVLAYEWDTWHTLKYILVYSKTRTQFLVARLVALLVVSFIGSGLVILFSTIISTMILLLAGKGIDVPTFGFVVTFVKTGLRVFLIVLASTLLGLWLVVLNPTVGKLGLGFPFMEQILAQFAPSDWAKELGNYLFTFQTERLYQIGEVEIGIASASTISGIDQLKVVAILIFYCVFFVGTMTWNLNRQDIK